MHSFWRKWILAKIVGHTKDKKHADYKGNNCIQDEARPLCHIILLIRDQTLPPFIWFCDKTRRGFQRASNFKTRCFVQSFADNLQSEWKPLTIDSRRNRNCRQSGQIRCHSENVVEVHLNRVAGLFAISECSAWTSWCEKRINISE